MNYSAFKKTVWDYYAKHGRVFPWRHEKDPYKILVSEIMLQQTQTDRVIKKYTDFLKRFPTISSLAETSKHEVLSLWQGLGYNRRALNLKRTAEILHEKYEGLLTSAILEKEKLPGIGDYTRGALLAFSWNIPTVCIETNIRTVFIYHFFKNTKNVHDDEIRKYVEATLDSKNPKEWYYALMDYGVHLKKTQPNPSRKSAHHNKQSPFKGSDREIRSHILRFVLKKPQQEKDLVEYCMSKKRTRSQAERIVNTLEKEGFMERKKGFISIKK